MPKAKTRKTVTKRFKVSGNGKLFAKHSRTSHRKRIDDSSTKSRKGNLIEISKGFAKKIKAMIIN
jgi:ribosomal protein L35